MSFLKYNKEILILIIYILFASCESDNTILLPDEEEVILTTDQITVIEPGYTDDMVLITPFTDGRTSYLMDRLGHITHVWSSSSPGFMGYLREDGSLVRPYRTNLDNGIYIGGKTGGIEIIDKDNNVVWQWTLDTTTETLHHDIALLPNGNILASVWEVKDRTECISNGRNPMTIEDDRLIIDKVIEIQPVGSNQANIVWEWSLWDHLVQNFDNTKLNFGSNNNGNKFDINQSSEGSNYSHINGLDYISSLDQIIINSRVLDEFIIIDHALTTQEAAADRGGRYNKGGDILYRWGNPSSYNSGDESDQMLHDQHDATFVGNNEFSTGTFLVFDNQDDVTFSTVKEINIPVSANGNYNDLPVTGNSPIAPVWSYSSTDITSIRTSGAQRLPNGNTLITSTSGNIIREINNNSEILWEFDATVEVDGVLEINSSGFKSRSYEKTYPGVIALGL